MALLRYAVLIMFIFGLTALAIQVFRGRRFGKRILHSEGTGDPLKGISYAMGKGMMPWEKESASRHLLTYVAGMLYHAGIFAAIAWSLSLALGISLPVIPVYILAGFILSGFLFGLGLLIKRILKLPMRSISCPDDYLSNILVDAFLLSACLSTLWSGLIPLFLIMSILTFFYMPMGKIRHCFYFFYSRILFGSYFGRRGVLPHKTT